MLSALAQIPADLLRPLWRLQTRHVTNQAVQLVGDLGQILVRAATEFEQFPEVLGVLPKNGGLAAFDLSKNDEVILQIFHRALDIVHPSY